MSSSVLTIGVGSDHHGFELKCRLQEFLLARGFAVRDFGCFSRDPVDYPDIAVAAIEGIRAGAVSRAVLVCRTGLGMAIVANKAPGIFAASVVDVATARQSRRSNDVQVLTLGAALVSPKRACNIVHAWLTTDFGGLESARKLEKVRIVEAKYRPAMQ